MNPDHSTTVRLSLLYDSSAISFNGDQKDQAMDCLNLIRSGFLIKKYLGDDWLKVADIINAEQLCSQNRLSQIKVRLYLSQYKCPTLYQEVIESSDGKSMLNKFFLLGVSARQQGIDEFVSQVSAGINSYSSKSIIDDVKNDNNDKGLSKDFLSMLNENDAS